MPFDTLLRGLVVFTAVSTSACTMANVGGDVSRSPVATPPGHGGATTPNPVNVTRGTPVTVSDATALPGGVWVLTALGGTEVTPAPNNPAHLSFAETNYVSGATGCNRLSGPATVDPKTMRFGALVTTRMACPGGGDLEARFLAALEATRSWAIDSGRLTLRNEQGDVVATLEHRETLPGA